MATKDLNFRAYEPTDPVGPTAQRVLQQIAKRTGGSVDYCELDDGLWCVRAKTTDKNENETPLAAISQTLAMAANRLLGFLDLHGTASEQKSLS